jgi:hypothetical protein
MWAVIQSKILLPTAYPSQKAKKKKSLKPIAAGQKGLIVILAVVR